jgi:site-specific DNA-methyltransferase (adenine-specific)
MKITDNIEITNEDNMLLMARYPDNYFDLAIVDPPYGIGINVSMGRRKGDKKSNYHKFAGKDSSIPNADYFKELKRVSKSQIVWGGNYMTEHLEPSSCWLMWDKGFSEDVTFAQFELAWTSFKSSAKKYDKHPSQQNRIHPTQKPIDLYKWILDRYAKPKCNHKHSEAERYLCTDCNTENVKILDTHLGSGSIAIACHDYKFDLTACELDKEYYDASVKRITNHVGQTKLF